MQQFNSNSLISLNNDTLNLFGQNSNAQIPINQSINHNPINLLPTNNNLIPTNNNSTLHTLPASTTANSTVDFQPNQLPNQATSKSTNTSKKPKKPRKKKPTVPVDPNKPKTYKCSICKKVFVNKADVHVHARQHKDGRPHKCSFCGKGFATTSYLKQHERIHRNIKPYKCDVCNRAFTQVSHLQQHRRLHTGDKPFCCPFANCGKTFVQLANLNHHRRTHEKKIKPPKPHYELVLNFIPMTAAPVLGQFGILSVNKSKFPALRVRPPRRQIFEISIFLPKMS